MTISRRTAIALTAAAVAGGAVPTAARDDGADAALAAAYERWHRLDQEADAAYAASVDIRTPIRNRALELFGFPRDEIRQHQYLAYLAEHDRAAGADKLYQGWQSYQDAAYGALDEIIEIPAQGVRGLLVKARLLQREFSVGESDFGVAIANSLVADLERLAGGSA